MTVDNYSKNSFKWCLNKSKWHWLWPSKRLFVKFFSVEKMLHYLWVCFPFRLLWCTLLITRHCPVLKTHSNCAHAPLPYICCSSLICFDPMVQKTLEWKLLAIMSCSQLRQMKVTLFVFVCVRACAHELVRTCVKASEMFCWWIVYHLFVTDVYMQIF